MLSRKEKNQQYTILNNILKAADIFDENNMNWAQKDFYKKNHSSDNIMQLIECISIGRLYACLSEARIMIIEPSTRKIAATIELSDPKAIEKIREAVAAQFLKMTYYELAAFKLRKLTTEQLIEFHNLFGLVESSESGGYYADRIHILGKYLSGDKEAFLPKYGNKE